TEDARDIFQDKPAWANLSSKFSKPKEQTASVAAEPFSLRVRVTDVLAWPSGGPKVSFRDACRFECGNVAIKWHLRPVSFEDPLPIGVDFAVENGRHPGALEAEIKSADSREEGCEPHSQSPWSSGMAQRRASKGLLVAPRVKPNE